MYHIIANPTAGRKKKNEKYNAVIQYIKENNIEHILYETKAYEDPIRIANQLSNDYTEGGKIIVIGGDGTLNEVINGLTNLDKWKVGIVPTGSGNDVASKLNIDTKNPIEALNLILNCEPIPIDLIEVNGMKGINIAGSGIDIDVLLRFERYKKLKGSFRYFCALFVTMLKFKWYTFHVSVDDEEEKSYVGFITAACNGSQYGGGIRICPDAIMDDGLLDFAFAKKISRIKIPYYLIKLMKGKINRYSFYEHRPCKKVVYSNDNDFYFNIDGKILKGNRFECKILPNALNIYRKYTKKVYNK